MKTAMQHLLEEFDNMPEYLFYTYLKVKRDELLEKEKKQIIDFGLYVKKNGWVGCKIEDLYEDYYNQKK